MNRHINFTRVFINLIGTESLVDRDSEQCGE